MLTSPFHFVHRKALSWLARNGQDREGSSTQLILRYHDEATGGLTSDENSHIVSNTTTRQWAIHRPAQRKIDGFSDGNSLHLYEIWITPEAVSSAILDRVIVVDVGTSRYKIAQKLETNGVDGLWRGVLQWTEAREV